MTGERIIHALDLTITPSVTTYTANDVIGGLLEFDNVPSAAGGLIIENLSIADEDNEGAEVVLHIFDQAPTAIADNAAFAPAFADLEKRVGKISIASADYETINSLKVVEKLGIHMATGSTKIYGYLVCTATPGYAGNKNLTIRLFVTE
jgi:hypothetical protein